MSATDNRSPVERNRESRLAPLPGSAVSWECPCCCSKNFFVVMSYSTQTDETSCEKCGTLYFLDDVIPGLPNAQALPRGGAEGGSNAK
jgi:uncharacterized protein YbaR (Trm112 family)